MSLMTSFWRLSGVSRYAVRAGDPRSRLAVEELEGREVPTVSVTEFSANITANGYPYGIATGPDGNLWFTESSANRIGRITPQGAVTEFSAGITLNSQPVGIAAGPDGNLWFTERNGNRIGRITPLGQVTEFSAGISANSNPFSIVAGPDGNLWFTEASGNRIGRVTPAGQVAEFSAGISPGSGPGGIAAGPDGNLWFTEASGNRIGRISTQGTLTEFSTGIFANSQPQSIAAGPDGNLWFTEYNSGLIGRITSQGLVAEFSAGISPNSQPLGIATGPDGNLWFTEFNTSLIGRITPQGHVAEFSAGITPNSNPSGIAAGPDGNLWFTEPAGRVARLHHSFDSVAVGLTGSATSGKYGAALSLTATVSVLSPGMTAPTGAVTFFDGAAPLGIAPVSNGTAFWNTSTLAAGSHTLTARYSGDPDLAPSTSPGLPETVTPATTIFTLSTSSPSSVAGDAVTYTATVANTDTSATPLGYVTFSDGITVVGVATLSGGLAAIGVTPALTGVHHLTAAFTPAAGFLSSQTDAPTDLTVTPGMAAGVAFAQQPAFALSGKYVRGLVSVRIQDQYGNLVTGSVAPVTISLVGPGKFTLAGTLSQPAVNGVATFADLKATGKGTGFTLTAASSGLVGVTSLPFTVSPTTHFRLTVSGSVKSGVPFTVTVTALDKAGKVDPLYLGSVDLSGTGLTGQTSGTFGSADKGKKTFVVTLPSAGKVTLTVADILATDVFGRLVVKVKA